MTIKSFGSLRTESSNTTGVSTSVGSSATLTEIQETEISGDNKIIKKMYSCSKCHKQITDRTVSMCDNRFWHQSCLTCQMCGHTPSPISGESLYAYRGSLICKNDYMRMNCVCKSCSRPITQSDMVIKTKNCGLLHDKCVFCRNCAAKLHTGDRYFMTVDNSLVCQKCMSSQPTPQTPSTLGPTSAPSTPGTGGSSSHPLKMEMDSNYSNNNFMRQQSHGSMGPPTMGMPSPMSGNGGGFMNNQNGMQNSSKHLDDGYQNGNYSNGMHGGMPTPPPGGMFNSSMHGGGQFSNMSSHPMMNGPTQSQQSTPSTTASTPTSTGTTTGGSRRGRKKQNQNNVNMM